jgi:hypothetical protein
MRTRRLVPIIAATLPFISFLPTAYAQQEQLPLLTPIQVLRPTALELDPGPPGFPPEILRFGRAISLRDGTALIGMPNYDGTVHEDLGLGRVAVFSRERSGTWVRSDTLDPSDPRPADFFGARVALGEHVALVGANSGVYVFIRRHGSWRQVQKLVPAADERFDGGLAVGKHVAFVGTSRTDDAGSVRVYWIDRRGFLHRAQNLLASDGSAGNRFGEQLALSGTTLLVGAAGDAQEQGAAYVFRGFGPFWFERQKLIAIDGAPGDLFGFSLAIGGGQIAIGAPAARAREADPPGACFGLISGVAYTFAQQRHLWAQQQAIDGFGAGGCTQFFPVDIAVNGRWLAGSSPSSFPFRFANTAILERVGGEFVPRAETLGSDNDAGVFGLSGNTLFVGQLDDRRFQIGFVEVYRLERTEP